MSGVPRLVIAAPSSGHGKTAVAIGLLSALRQYGLRTAGFKMGPDYVDAAYLGLAAGSPARNLDPSLVGSARMAPLFLHGAAGYDIAVVEGAMGLYDGLAGRTDSDSTAQLAGVLRAPVVLVVDAGAMGQSVAALAHGFRAYDELLWLGGVILNRVLSDRHEELLREALDDVGIPVFGAVRRHQLTDAGLPARNQGVVPVVQETVEARRAVRQLGEVVAATVDLQQLIALARSAPGLAAEPWAPDAARGREHAPDAARGREHAPEGRPPVQPMDQQPWAQTVDPQPAEPLIWSQTLGTLESPGASVPGGADRSDGTLAAQPGDGSRREAGVAAGTEPAPPGPDDAGLLRLDDAGLLRLDDADLLRLDAADPSAPGTREAAAPPVVAVAGGSRIWYGYTEVVDLLTAVGAQVVPVDPLRDEALPPGTRGLVLGGALPEAYVEELSGNLGLIGAVRALARAGGPIVAEGVGLAFLVREYGGRPMAGLLDARGETGEQLALGYREATARSASPFLDAGTRVVGYRRHRGLITPRAGEQPAWSWPGGSPEGFVLSRIHASYLCLHWAGVPQMAHGFVAAVQATPGLRAAA